MSVAESGRVTVEEGVVFGQGGGRELKCDVYTPPGNPTHAPAVLLIHGGGWSGGDRTQLKGHGILLGRAGYVCVATEYRLSGEAQWPAPLHDVKAALRWMRANASRLGMDPARIAVSGNSAGGHLSLMVAGTPNVAEFEGDGGNPGVDTSVVACISIYPPVELQPGSPLDGAVGMLMGKGASDAAYAGASPMSHVKPGFPPTLLIHGNKDELVPEEASHSIYRALRKAGASAELHVYADQPHAFDASPVFGRQTVQIMDLFLRRYVVESEAAPAALEVSH